MTREQKYDAVNATETLDELSSVIKSFADENGMIQGRTKKFSAKSMAHACLALEVISPSQLTRDFGIRQQGVYIVTFYD